MSESLEQQRLLAAAVARLQLLQKRTVFDPARLGSKPTPAQQQVLDDFGVIKHQYIRAGNQGGKTTTCARLLTWVLTDTHPTWKRPDMWGSEPLLAIVAARTGKQIEESLMPRILSYLEPGSYKVVRIGNITQRLEMVNGNRVVFQSLENPTVARERLQSYTGHIAWLDELPPTVAIISELLRSIQANDGLFMASFTPLTRSLEVQKFIDNVQAPKAKVYRFNMLDNPVYSDPIRKQEIMDTLSGLSEIMRNSRLYGDWVTSDDQVYSWNWDTMVAMPPNYSPLWRHVESVDPALSSAIGLTIWAEDPRTYIWYCVKAKYLKGLHVPTRAVEAVIAETQGLNIIRRISDPHEVWYIGQASQAPYHLSYMGVYKKNDRKQELIASLQQKLGTQIRISPLDATEDLVQEIQDCRWSERQDGSIVNGSKYHLLDSAQYFCDNIPRAEKSDLLMATSWQDHLYQANEKRKLNIEKKKQKIEGMIMRKLKGRTRGRISR